MNKLQASAVLRPKVIITGTGRAGTTFLVQLLTELGEDTGYTRENWARFYDAHCAAGLEHDLTGGTAPRIVKNPALCETLPGLLARGEVVIEHAFVPVRALDEATRSRVWIGGAGRTPGGLWGTTEADRQRGVLAEKFHELVHALVVHEVPHTFLAFPRVVRDADYAWEKLRVVLPATGREEFVAAFRRVARPELVHDFSRGFPGPVGQAGRDYERAKLDRRKRWRRRRFMAGSAIALTVGALGCWLARGSF